MKLIGITGYKTEGKTELANALWRYGYERHAFANPVKELATEVGWDGTKRGPEEYDVDPDLEVAADRYGTTDALRFAPGAYNGRLLLDRIGMGVRRLVGEDAWIRALSRKLFDPPYSDDRYVVVDDVRFPNEADWIRVIGGHIVRVIRKGVIPDFNFESERHVHEIPVDYYVLNCRDLEWLHAQAEHVAGEPWLE